MEKYGPRLETLSFISEVEVMATATVAATAAVIVPNSDTFLNAEKLNRSYPDEYPVDAYSGGAPVRLMQVFAYVSNLTFILIYYTANTQSKEQSNNRLFFGKPNRV